MDLTVALLTKKLRIGVADIRRAVLCHFLHSGRALFFYCFFILYFFLHYFFFYYFFFYHFFFFY